MVQNQMSKEHFEAQLSAIANAIREDKPELATVLAISVGAQVLYDLNRVANAAEKLAGKKTWGI